MSISNCYRYFLFLENVDLCSSRPIGEAFSPFKIVWNYFRDILKTLKKYWNKAQYSKKITLLFTYFSHNL